VKVRETTITDLDRLASTAHPVEVVFQMDEEAFRGFYDRTSRALWSYLARITADRHLADDLMQETYYRFLRGGRQHESEAHRRNSLFLTATNLVKDVRRRSAMRPEVESGGTPAADAVASAATHHQQRADLHRAMSQLSPRERQLLWLAYAEGASHREIAATLGLKAASIKLLLFRARRRLAGLLGRGAR
jgi:RNA polymerase sigma-70 factor, ECF subfamily